MNSLHDGNFDKFALLLFIGTGASILAAVFMKAFIQIEMLERGTLFSFGLELGIAFLLGLTAVSFTRRKRLFSTTLTILVTMLISAVWISLGAWSAIAVMLAAVLLFFALLAFS